MAWFSSPNERRLSVSTIILNISIVFIIPKESFVFHFQRLTTSQHVSIQALLVFRCHASVGGVRSVKASEGSGSGRVRRDAIGAGGELVGPAFPAALGVAVAGVALLAIHARVSEAFAARLQRGAGLNEAVVSLLGSESSDGRNNEGESH